MRASNLLVGLYQLPILPEVQKEKKIPAALPKVLWVGEGKKKRVQFWQGFAFKCSEQAEQIPAPQAVGS